MTTGAASTEGAHEAVPGSAAVPCQLAARVVGARLAPLLAQADAVVAVAPPEL